MMDLSGAVWTGLILAPAEGRAGGPFQPCFPCDSMIPQLAEAAGATGQEGCLLADVSWPG